MKNYIFRVMFERTGDLAHFCISEYSDTLARLAFQAMMKKDYPQDEWCLLGVFREIKENENGSGLNEFRNQNRREEMPMHTNRNFSPQMLEEALNNDRLVKVLGAKDISTND